MAKSRHLSLTTKGALVVTLPVTALLVAMAVFYQFARRSGEAERALEQTFETRSEIRRLLTQMLNAETGIRGYLLTDRPNFLEPYDAALRELPVIHGNLRRLVGQSPTQSA